MNIISRIWEHINGDPFVRDMGFVLVNCKRFAMGCHHYYPLSRIEEILKEKELAFVYPAKWNDPYETLYLTTDFSSLGGYKQKKIFCFCVRGCGNEEAAWNVYSNGTEPLVCVRFNIKNLFPCIKEFATKNNCKVYYSKVSYDLNTNEIRNLGRNKTLRKKFFKNFDEKKYIRLMSLKRKPFKYEEEYRIFIVPQADSPLKGHNDILKIPIDINKVFERFTIYPLKRLRSDDGLMSKINEMNYKQQKEIIKTFIEKKLNDSCVSNVKIYSSSLYNDVKPIDKIT